jgi:hypothetical protein
MRKILGASACIVVLAIFAIKGFPGPIWHLTHGSTYKTDRISMKLDPRWLVRRNDKGQDEIERPETFSAFPIAGDTIWVHESTQCPASETEMEETYDKALANQSRHLKRPLGPIVHLTSSPEVIDCAELTLDGGLLDCYLPKDGTYARILTTGLNGSAKQEALAMVKSIRIIKPCVPKTH